MHAVSKISIISPCNDYFFHKILLILNWRIFKLYIRPLKWHTYIVNCTENAGVSIFISQEHF